MIMQVSGGLMTD